MSGKLSRCYLQFGWLVLAALLPGMLLAQVSFIPEDWSFEDIPVGTAVVDTNGVGSYGWAGEPFSPTNNGAEIVLEEYTWTGDYPIAGATHSNVMQVLGEVSNTFDRTQSEMVSTQGYVTVDCMVKAGHLAGAQDKPVGAQVALYVGTNSQIMLYHARYTDVNFSEGTRDWTELTHDAIDSNDWARVTLKMDYFTGLYADGEHFFQISLNGGAWLSSPLAYSTTSPSSGIPDGGTYFLCADSGYFGGGGPNNQFFGGVGFSGAGRLDDVVVTAEAGGGWIITPYTSAGGQIVPGTPQSVSEGGNATFTVSAANFFRDITNVTKIPVYDGGPGPAEIVAVTNPTSMTVPFANVTNDWDLYAYFSGQTAAEAWLASHGLTVDDWGIDSDGDGVVNRDEYEMSTDPRAKASVLRVVNVSPFSSSNVVTWTYADSGGADSDFLLYRSTNLLMPNAGFTLYASNITRSVTFTTVWPDLSPPAQGETFYIPKVPRTQRTGD